MFTENKSTHVLQRKTTNKDEIRKKILRLKSTFISSMNENDDNDYINCYMKGWCAKITEGKTKLELAHGGGQNQKDGFILDENNDEKIPFV